MIVRTPREIVLKEEAVSLRVPTETGHVGLRPGAESAVMAVESGIVQMRLQDRVLFAGTPGGLLRWDGATATVLTPLAIVGENAGDIAGQLDKALGAPSAEMAARKALERLEGRIISELRRGVADRAGKEGLTQ